ncbi:MAG: ABC transporter permease, partial [Bacteroidota bacterium]
MWFNHFKVTLRSIFKYKLVSGIKILGLGLGILCGLLVIIYVKKELSYDRWIPEHENIYRLYRHWGETRNDPTSPAPLDEALRENIAGLEAVTRVAFSGEALLTHEEAYHKVPTMISVNRNFLDCIQLPLAQGNPTTALHAPNSALISEKLAKQIFGETSPIGKQLLLRNEYYITINGVLAPFKGPSHLDADLFLSNLDEIKGGWTDRTPAQIYVRLQPKVDPAQVSEQVSRIYRTEIGLAYQEQERTFDADQIPSYKLQAISAIHKQYKMIVGFNPQGFNFRQVAIIGLLGMVVLLLAIVNYINLATAQLHKKSEEIGVRRVIGATQKDLIRQFVSNALIHVLLGLTLALCIIPYVLPFLNEIVSRSLVQRDLL